MMEVVVITKIKIIKCQVKNFNDNKTFSNDIYISLEVYKFYICQFYDF
jgi:hypothetical protein